ncbi:hypothetical protein HDU83_005412, partial [Entophlyctis luteolus]
MAAVFGAKTQDYCVQHDMDLYWAVYTACGANWSALQSASTNFKSPAELQSFCFEKYNITLTYPTLTLLTTSVLATATATVSQ